MSWQIVTVSDNKIQIPILILRRGALSSHDCRLEDAQQGGQVPQLELISLWNLYCRLEDAQQGGQAPQPAPCWERYTVIGFNLLVLFFTNFSFDFIVSYNVFFNRTLDEEAAFREAKFNCQRQRSIMLEFDTRGEVLDIVFINIICYRSYIFWQPWRGARYPFILISVLDLICFDTRVEVLDIVFINICYKSIFLFLTHVWRHIKYLASSPSGAHAQ